jgi:hypothetical protein
LDLALAAQEGRQPRASGALAYHVFEVMDAIERAPKFGAYQTIESRCAAPEPLPVDFLNDERKELAHAD